MFFNKGSAAALAISSLSSIVLAAEVQQTCAYKPAWNQCLGDEYSAFECATILVTQSYLQPPSAENTYELNLIRYPARDNYDNAESIITNFGGPGSSGIQALLGQGADLSAQVNGTLHIISFDPRGVGVNDPYNCDSSASYPQSNNYHDQSVVNAQYAAALQTAQDCNAQNPVKGTQIGTIAVARDVRQIARAVGVNDQLIRYWGFSYGTVLGDTIARLYPTEIGGMVLDGNINPNDYWFQFPVQEAGNIDAGVRHFFQLCADAQSESDCAWNVGGNGTYDTLLKKFNDWVGATPADRGVNSKLNVEESFNVRDVIYQAIKYGFTFQKGANVLQTWYLDRTKIKSVGAFTDYPDPGLPSKQKRQYVTDGSGDFTPSKSNASNEYVLTAITGSDNQYRPLPLNGQVYTSWLNQYENTSQYASQYAGDLSISNLWGYAPWVPKAEEYFDTAFENIETTPSPILFIQTHFDPVTPNYSGLAAHAAFINSGYVTTNGVGHCSSSDSSSALKAAVGLYWTSDVLPAENTNYPLDNPNPFNSSNTPATDNIETNLNPTSDTLKRDLSTLFRPFLVARAGSNHTGLSCQELGANATTTSAFASSTTTGNSSTVTGTGNSSTITGTGKVSTTSTNSYTTGTNNYTYTNTYTSGKSTSTSTSASGAGTYTYTYTSGTGTYTYTYTSGTASSATGTTSTGTWTAIYTGTGTASSKTSTGSSTSTTAKNSGAWGNWDGSGSSSSTTRKSRDPKSSSTASSGWNSWTSDGKATTTTTTRKTRSTTVSSSSSTQWQGWNQADGSSKATTTYVYSVVDVCPTGLVTSKVTITATCDKSCGGKPAIPDGYKTTTVYCSACAPPSTVTVTVKVTGSTSTGVKPATATGSNGDWNNWGNGGANGGSNGGANGVKPATATGANGDWNNWGGNGNPNSVKPTTTATSANGDWNNWGSSSANGVKPTTATGANGDWNNWGNGDSNSVKPTTATGGNGDWNNWGSGTGTAQIAKYTGAASANSVVRGGLYVAVAAAVLAL